MRAEGPEGLADPIEGAQIADRTEETQNGVVTSAEIEGRHIPNVEMAGGMFPTGDRDERRIEIEAVDFKSLRCQEPRMLASATRRIKRGAALRIVAAQQAGEYGGISPIVPGG